MLLKTITDFDGHSVNGATAYGVELWVREATFQRTATPQYIQRRNAHGTVDSMQLQPVRIVAMVTALNTSVSRATFVSNVENWFSLSTDSTLRTLAGTSDDGTAVSVPALIVGFELLRDVGTAVTDLYYRVTFELPGGQTQATAATTATTSPVTNAGNTTAIPSIALTTATQKTIRRCTVSGAGSGGGFTAFPVRFLLSSAAATATNVYVYIEGASVPCVVTGGGGSSSAVWALVDTASDGTATNVDIVYGTGLTNTLCGQLDASGFDFTNATNTLHRWNAFLTSGYSARAGVWHSGSSVGATNTSNQVSGISAEATAGITFKLNDTTISNGGGNGMFLNVGASAGVTNALSGLSRVTAGFGAAADAMFAVVKYRVAGSTTWTDAWTNSGTSNATVTTAISVPNAVEIFVGMEYRGVSTGGLTPTLALAGTGVPAFFTLALITTPTVTVGTAANLNYYNGTLRIGATGPSITFTEVMVLDGTLTIDAGARTITSNQAASPFYGSLTWSDPDVWLSVAPGSNTITVPVGASFSLTFNAGYA